MLLTIVAFFFVLSVVVFVHELGHFVVAKLNGVFVISFSFGFGPRLLSKRFGETEYAIRVLPFGGYVKFAGESPEDESGETDKELKGMEVSEDRYYRRKSPLQRMSVVVAGPFMNVVLALVVYICSFLFEGIYVNPSTVVGEVRDGSPAAAAGFEVGDRILEINGETFAYWEQLYDLIILEEGVETRFAVLRDSDTLMISFAPEFDPEEELWNVGIHSPLPPKVGSVQRGSPADKAGLKRGSSILAVNDTTVHTYDELAKIIHAQPGVPLKIDWEHDGALHSAIVTPESGDAPKEGERLDIVEVGQIGILPYFEKVNLSFVEAVTYGSRMVYLVLKSIISFLGKYFTGKVTLRAVGGPLRIGVMAGDMIRWGFNHLITLLAFISLNLAVVNLLPIVPFDGGHFVLYGIELVTRRRINQKVQQVIMQVGFVILIALMVFIFLVDILNIFR